MITLLHCKPLSDVVVWCDCLAIEFGNTIVIFSPGLQDAMYPWGSSPAWLYTASEAPNRFHKLIESYTISVLAEDFSNPSLPSITCYVLKKIQPSICLHENGFITEMYHTSRAKVPCDWVLAQNKEDLDGQFIAKSRAELIKT